MMVADLKLLLQALLNLNLLSKKTAQQQQEIHRKLLMVLHAFCSLDVMLQLSLVVKFMAAF